MTENTINVSSSAAETEALMEQTIIRVAEIHERMKQLESNVNRIPDIQRMIESVSIAQAVMAKSAESMADTFRKSEERYERMEVRHEALAELATGKDQIPLKSHYWTLFATLLPTVVMSMGVVVGVLYISKYDIKAFLTTLEVNQHKTQELISDLPKKVEEQKVK